MPSTPPVVGTGHAQGRPGRDPPVGHADRRPPRRSLLGQGQRGEPERDGPVVVLPGVVVEVSADSALQAGALRHPVRSSATVRTSP